ncbi:phosphoribosylanthranilate isomerase [Achromobacter sp. F4_2707]|uniref:phosphoribosylanthranilate isomerase n=1 Tax=Achromobacter sp. F4_2707 TaxID=3114286 RepID=UPI0039C5F7AF
MTKRTRIKFCGFTRLEDVKAAVEAGVDAVGVIFFSKSRRAVSIEQASALRAAVPAFVDLVALFVNADQAYVQEVIDTVSPDILQFHGTEQPFECERYNKRYMKAFRVGGPGMETREEVLEQCRRYGSADAWLFDSFSDSYGGSGEGFDLSLLGAVVNAPDARPIVLAGGLAADNVASQMRKLRPYAVDVASGIEDEPGIKSVEKMKAFSQAVSAADNEVS